MRNNAVRQVDGTLAHDRSKKRDGIGYARPPTVREVHSVRARLIAAIITTLVVPPVGQARSLNDGRFLAECVQA